MSATVTASRVWAMPNARTFSMPPVREFIRRWQEQSEGISIDPFARNSHIADVTNDLSPTTEAEHHMDALDFLKMFEDGSVGLVLYDPPYSPRQLKEVYDSLGQSLTSEQTSARFWSQHKQQIGRVLKPGGVALSFGWNSSGIGKKYGFDIEEILLVSHGGQHNDTICVASRKRKPNMDELDIDNMEVVNA